MYGKVQSVVYTTPFIQQLSNLVPDRRKLYSSHAAMLLFTAHMSALNRIGSKVRRNRPALEHDVPEMLFARHRRRINRTGRQGEERKRERERERESKAEPTVGPASTRINTDSKHHHHQQQPASSHRLAKRVD